MKFAKAWITKGLVLVVPATACGGTMGADGPVYEGPFDAGGPARPVDYAGTPPVPTTPDDAGPATTERLVAPTNLRAQVTSGSTVRLTWQDNSTTETAVVVERKTVASASFSTVGAAPAGATTFIDSALSAATIYVYRVRATTPFAQSEPSNEATVTTDRAEPPPSPTQTPPRAPSILIATLNIGSINLTWRDNADNESEFVVTIAEQRPSGLFSSTQRVGANITTLSWPHVATNYRYEFRVSAKNAAGSSAAATATLDVPLAAPTGLAATPGDGRVDLRWTASPGATDYEVRRSRSSGSGYTKVATAVGTSYADMGVTNGTTYYYVVVAKSLSLTSAYSTEISASPTAPTPTPTLAAPTGLTATPGDQSVTLTWNSVTGATSYDILVSSWSGSGYRLEFWGLNATTYTARSLVIGRTYYFVVVARTGVQTSAYSNEVSAIPTAPSTPAPLAAPANLTATPRAGGIDLAWDAVSGATSYQVYLSDTSGSGFQSVFGPVSGTTLAFGSTASYRRYFVVAAKRGSETSAYSNEASATPLPSISSTPDPPTAVTATPGDGRVELRWTASTFANAYEILRSTTSGSGYASRGRAIGTSFTDLPAANGTAYFYVVVALNGAQPSRNSTEVSATPQATTPAPLAAPTGLTATASGNSVTLNWNAVAGATEYVVFISRTPGSGYLQAGSAGSSTTLGMTIAISGSQTYVFVVAAKRGSETSAYSNEVSATVHGSTP